MLSKLRHWLNRPKAGVQRVVQIRTLHGGIDLPTWQQSSSRTDWAKELFRTRMGKDLISVLRNEIPRPQMDNEHIAAMSGAAVRGYMICLDTLLALAEEPKKQPTLPEATYETEGGPQLIEDETE